jgi:uncharacterized membrane protein
LTRLAPAADTAGMDREYNKIAGRSVERIAALSDGLFAIAMTLIVLEIHVPEPHAVTGEAGLWSALGELTPRFVTFLLSFLTLGIFWVGQQTQLNQLVRADRNLAWLHILFLALVSVMPFSTSLLAEFITYKLALLLYWANILALGAALYAASACAARAGLVKTDAPAHFAKAVERRIVTAQALYACGAALCLVSTYWSIGFIVLVQLNYAIDPAQFFRRPKASAPVAE